MNNLLYVKIDTLESKLARKFSHLVLPIHNFRNSKYRLECDLFVDYYVKRAPADGNCFYHSFAIALFDNPHVDSINIDDDRHVGLRKEANDAKNKTFALSNEQQSKLGVWAEMVEIKGLVNSRNVTC